MRISGPRPPMGVTRTGASAPVRTAAPVQAGHATIAAQDVASVLGIPGHEFTPRVRDAIQRLMVEVDRLRQELGQQRSRLSQLETEADQDPLVPCLNRRAFVREMSRVLSFVERYDIPASMVFLDLDNFKQINDRLGHAAGDAALIHVCELLKVHVRDSDHVGRLGGDEFGILLAKSDQAEAERKAEMLGQLIKAAPLVWLGKAVPLGFTTGAYAFVKGENPAEAMARADRAMYERKARARPKA